MPACGSESASVGSFLCQSWVSVYGIIDSDIVKRFKLQDNKDERNKLYDEFSEKIDLLEQKLYLHTDFPMWEMLYAYLDDEIKKL